MRFSIECNLMRILMLIQLTRSIIFTEKEKKNCSDQSDKQTLGFIEFFVVDS